MYSKSRDLNLVEKVISFFLSGNYGRRCFCSLIKKINKKILNIHFDCKFLHLRVCFSCNKITLLSNSNSTLSSFFVKISFLSYIYYVSWKKLTIIVGESSIPAGGSLITVRGFSIWTQLSSRIIKKGKIKKPLVMIGKPLAIKNKLSLW